MRSRAAAILGLVVSFGLAVIAPVTGVAATAVADDLRIDEVDLAGYPDVAFTISVPMATLGTDLGSDDVAVLEDGQPRTHTLERLAGDDLAVLLLVDTSGSMSGGPLEAARTAAAAFLGDLPAGTPAAVGSFGSAPTAPTAFTTDRQQQLAALDDLAPAGETALNDALVAAAAHLPTGTDLHRAIVLLSDGGDTVSTTTADEALAALAAAGATVHAIELTTPESDRPALRRVTDATGGTLTSTTDPAALRELYGAVASTLVNRYRVVYRSAGSGATDLTVDVTAGAVAATATRQLQLPVLRPATTAPAPVPQRGTVSDPGWVGGTWVLPTGATAVFAALAFLLLPLLAPHERRSVLDGPSGGLADRLGQLPGLRSIADHLVGAADRRIEGERRRQVASRLERAGVSLRPGEAVVLTVAGMTTVGAAVSALTNPLLGVAAAVSVAFLARTAVSVMAQRRSDAFTDQLPDTLQVLGGSLRAGHGLLQAIDTVANEAADPTAEEFRRVVVEVRLGRDLDVALAALADRIAVDDVHWMVQAMEIHRRVGGDLAEVLDNVAHTVRERMHVRGQIRALSAEGRISAWILGALPLVVMAALQLIRPGYFGALLAHSLGRMLAAGGAALMVLGILWIRRLIRVVY